MNDQPLSLYMHLPWCVRKCPYCDFNSYRAADNAPRQRYINAVIKDLEFEAQAEADRNTGRQLCSVFIGGGTPSFFTPAEINQLLDGVRTNFRLAAGAEITMEANPGTLECGDPAGYREAGVNRLSIGAQSFSDESLRQLGRIHSSSDIRRSVMDAQAAGFARINLDLMYALPGQDVTSALDDIEQAVALNPGHISWYQLTLEPNTVFYARPPADLPDQELCFDIQENGQARLRECGFEQYEVSAYARDGERCRHNLSYWSFGDYIAVGAGAHGKVTDAEGVRRYAKAANPQSFMQLIESGQQPLAQPVLGTADLLFEFMLNALRLTQGFDERLYQASTGLDIGYLRRAAASALERGLLTRSGDGIWQATPLGHRFLNDLQAEFLPA